MPLDLLYSKPGHLARRFQQIAVAIFMEETAAFGVTPVQYATLMALRDNPDIDATQLGRLVALDRSTLGNVLTRLQAKRLVGRRASKADKRAKLLRVTPTGSALLRKLEPAVRRADARIIAPVSVGDRKRLLDLLSQLVRLNNQFSRAPLGGAVPTRLRTRRQSAGASLRADDGVRARSRPRSPVPRGRGAPRSRPSE
jgi:MarR family transcriptional regulator, lower aerobic nicotinate degradation pathway regulator